MNAATEIRNHADMFGWDCHTDHRRHADTFVRGSHMVAVNYRRDGAVDQASRYTFFKVTDPKFQERTGCANKKSAVVSWLVRFGD